MRTGWRFRADRGGTSTDIVARRPDGRPLTHKLLSRFGPDGNLVANAPHIPVHRGPMGTLVADDIPLNDNVGHQYYETVASGSGAGDGFDGAPVVRTHMTNLRLTDPEVLERRLPVPLEEFTVRRGSGGAGRWRGGDGAVRRIRFLEPMTVSAFSQHRRVPPYGMAGGRPGALGANRVERADGTVTELGGSDAADVGPGDVLVIETPGGGGYGPPSPHPQSAGEETNDLRAF